MMISLTSISILLVMLPSVLMLLMMLLCSPMLCMLCTRMLCICMLCICMMSTCTLCMLCTHMLCHTRMLRSVLPLLLPMLSVLSVRVRHLSLSTLMELSAVWLLGGGLQVATWLRPQEIKVAEVVSGWRGMGTSAVAGLINRRVMSGRGAVLRGWGL